MTGRCESVERVSGVTNSFAIGVMMMTNVPGAAAAEGLAARLAGVPLILYTAHGTAFQDGQSPLARRAFQCLEKLGNSWGHKTVFVNNSDREKCLSLGLVPPEKALTVYNALPASPTGN